MSGTSAGVCQFAARAAKLRREQHIKGRKKVKVKSFSVRAAFVFAAVVCTLAVSTGSAAASVSIVNPSFETGTLAGWSGSAFVTTNYAG